MLAGELGFKNTNGATLAVTKTSKVELNGEWCTLAAGKK
jgi:hypothetical protein